MLLRIQIRNIFANHLWLLTDVRCAMFNIKRSVYSSHITRIFTERICIIAILRLIRQVRGRHPRDDIEICICSIRVQPEQRIWTINLFMSPRACVVLFAAVSIMVIDIFVQSNWDRSIDWRAQQRRIRIRDPLDPLRAHTHNNARVFRWVNATLVCARWPRARIPSSIHFLFPHPFAKVYSI